MSRDFARWLALRWWLVRVAWVNRDWRRAFERVPPVQAYEMTEGESDTRWLAR